MTKSLPTLLDGDNLSPPTETNVVDACLQYDSYAFYTITIAVSCPSTLDHMPCSTLKVSTIFRGGNASAPLPLSPASLPAPGVLLLVLPFRFLVDFLKFLLGPCIDTPGG